jgi:hypothetical protein
MEQFELDLTDGADESLVGHRAAFGDGVLNFRITY